jgi:hypothetical protein
LLFTLEESLMRLRPFITALSLASALSVFAGMSRADSTVTLQVEGAYSDATTFSGLLVYDQTTQAFINGSITDSGPLQIFGFSIDPQTYTGQSAYTITLPGGCVSGCQQFGAEF